MKLGIRRRPSLGTTPVELGAISLQLAHGEINVGDRLWFTAPKADKPSSSDEVYLAGTLASIESGGKVNGEAASRTQHCLHPLPCSPAPPCHRSSPSVRATLLAVRTSVSGELLELQISALLPGNADTGRDDLCTLPHLNEATVLANVQVA